MSRLDISPNLIHFTSDVSDEAAFQRLQKIVREKTLLGTGRLIKGGFSCVCFSEAPLTSLSDGLLNEHYYSRYSPFGIMVAKKWLFAQGGRPVIYQANSEYDALPESHRWRHMLFEIRENFAFADFTWEREWRIPCERLEFSPADATLVVPDAAWAARLVQEHDDDEDYTVAHYSVVMGQVMAEAYRQPFGWTVLNLK
jgi:hypothetical protein